MLVSRIQNITVQNSVAWMLDIALASGHAIKLISYDKLDYLSTFLIYSVFLNY
jgi:hypothetical protein